MPLAAIRARILSMGTPWLWGRSMAICRVAQVVQGEKVPVQVEHRRPARPRLGVGRVADSDAAECSPSTPSVSTVSLRGLPSGYCDHQRHPRMNTAAVVGISSHPRLEPFGEADSAANLSLSSRTSVVEFVGGGRA